MSKKKALPLISIIRVYCHTALEASVTHSLLPRQTDLWTSNQLPQFIQMTVEHGSGSKSETAAEIPKRIGAVIIWSVDKRRDVVSWLLSRPRWPFHTTKQSPKRGSSNNNIDELSAWATYNLLDKLLSRTVPVRPPANNYYNLLATDLYFPLG